MLYESVFFSKKLDNTTLMSSIGIFPSPPTIKEIYIAYLITKTIQTIKKFTFFEANMVNHIYLRINQKHELLSVKAAPL